MKKEENKNSMRFWKKSLLLSNHKKKKNGIKKYLVNDK